LGASGASQYIKAMMETPYRPAAHLFPAAASANKNIFYNSNGSPKTLSQIYNHFQAKFDDVTGGQPIEVARAPAVDKSYTRDLSFERMYGDNIQKFVRTMPSITGFESGSFFEGLFGQKKPSWMQNHINAQSLFLTLTMLDSSK
jgi:hypothetical protein